VSAKRKFGWQTGLFGSATAVVCALALWWQFANPLTKSALLQPKLDGTAPRYFVLPPDLTDAVQKLTRMGARLYSVEKSDHCIFHSFGSSRTVYVLAVEDWRGGTICIVPSDRNVGEVYWQFQIGAP
jgi:hypothetical protein